MNATEQILSRVIAWATRETNVRRLLLVGSRARAACPDDLADIDLQVYTVATTDYLQQNEWLFEIGEMWLCVRDEYLDGGVRVATRLIIFKGGVKVDLAFYPAGMLSNGVRSGLAYKTLVDKDVPGVHRDPEPVCLEEPAVPSEADFGRVIEEFWFEAYHVAKYLARNELWLAKTRDWSTKQCLLSMIEWHERFMRGRSHDPDCASKRTSVSEETWQALHESFAGFGADESWRQLTIKPHG